MHGARGPKARGHRVCIALSQRREDGLEDGFNGVLDPLLLHEPEEDAGELRCRYRSNCVFGRSHACFATHIFEGKDRVILIHCAVSFR